MVAIAFSPLLERAGEPGVLAVLGGAVGLGFGFAAQRSQFCLRSAVIEFARGRPGAKLAVWLLVFAAALAAVQLAVALRWIDVSAARPLATRGSLSGAVLGGLLFGAGMIMTRGCASRLLVLSATGNLRALLSGLIFAVTAQASLGGALAPARQAVAGWWTVEGGASRDLLALTGAGRWGGLAIAAVWLAGAVSWAWRMRCSRGQWLGGVCSGLAVAAAWVATAAIAAASFSVVPVQGVTFSGPSAEWLMRVLATPGPAIGFDSGLLPGVFAGAFTAAASSGGLALQGFGDGYGMRRYIAGAVCMGFGSMLAGGCAVGAGISGGAVFALTAWLALTAMWVGAAAADRVLDGGAARAP
jgi:uncharacterized membrane protein YedE/YeeE